MREKKWYIKEVIRIMRQIDNTVILMKIYTFAKTHLEILQEKEGVSMNRIDIAKAIAEDLLNNGTLDDSNFSYDADALLDYVQKMILEHLKDYMIISGSVL